MTIENWRLSTVHLFIISFMTYNIQQTSLSFALLVIDTYKFLTKIKKEYVLSKQLLRSWTSIWANIQEANQGSSKKDFLHIMNISLKEAHETEYRITLLSHSEYLEWYTWTETLIAQSKEMVKVLIKIVKTTKERLNE